MSAANTMDNLCAALLRHHRAHGPFVSAEQARDVFNHLLLNEVNPKPDADVANSSVFDLIPELDDSQSEHYHLMRFYEVRITREGALTITLFLTGALILELP